jgi:hypothetical protein
MNRIPAEERVLQETQAACLVLFIHHVHCSHSTLFSGYLQTIIVLWDLGYQRLVRRHCTTCYLLFHWLLRAERQMIEPESKLMTEP